MYDDFSSSANMDDWVNKKTFGLINSIGIQPDRDTRMVLANALAIQMNWKYKFSDDDTGGRAFYKKDGSPIEVTTMQKETYAEDIKYYVDNDMTALSLPLDSTSEDMQLEFVAMMPASDIGRYIEKMKANDVDELIGKLQPASEAKDGVSYYIPKFKYDYDLSFQNDLMALGIKSAFDGGLADFSRMSSEPLYVGRAVHKANIDFSEEGIKAAAVTVFAMKDGMAVADEPEPVEIHLDHPFIFIIRDAKNGAIWFTGAVYEPNLWADDAAQYGERY